MEVRSMRMIDGHVHIERGNYTLNWINEFVKYALERGISEIYLLEHSHRFKEFEKVYESIVCYNEFQRCWLNERMTLSLNDYINLISEVRKSEFPLEIKFGLEICYVEGTETIVKNVLNNFNWDFVTGSVHWIDGWGFDHNKEFWKNKDVDKLYKRYYEIMKDLIKSGLFNTVAHPDSIKCFGYYPSFDLTEIYSEIADMLNEYDMNAEQSAGLCLNYEYHELGMNRKMYDIFRQKNIRMYTASDAHRPEDTGKYIKDLNEMFVVCAGTKHL